MTKRSVEGTDDDLQLNTADDFGLREWALRLGITHAALMRAIMSAGPKISDIKREIGLIPPAR